MRPLPKYLPNDHHKHLGDMPWKQSDVVDAWIAAHNHDPRTKCIVEYGCQALEDHYEWLVEAYERDSEAWAQTSDPANVTDHIDVLRHNVAAAYDDAAYDPADDAADYVDPYADLLAAAEDLLAAFDEANRHP